MGADGHLAAAFKAKEERSFGGNGGCCSQVMKKLQ